MSGLPDLDLIGYPRWDLHSAKGTGDVVVSRRQLLRAGTGASAALLLSSCAGGGNNGPAPAGPPKPGGTLRIGALGRASSVTRDPHGLHSNDSDNLVLALAYDPLTVPGSSPVVAPRLARRWEPSPDLREWRFELPPNARFHDGRPVTSADVVWSLRRLRQSPSGSSRLPGVRPEAIRADGPNAVVLRSSYPNSELPAQIRMTTFTVPENSPDPSTAPGTGPFKVDWYRAGNARLVRNDDWFGGRPWLDAVEVRMFETPEAITNALLSEEIDLASNVGSVAARTAERRDGLQIVRRPDDMAMPVVMRTSDGPFADPRVREAVRLAVDRDAMVRQGLSGYGSVANDVLGTADPLYARDLPQRRQDLARAGRLLDEAGFDRSRTYPIATTEAVPGLTQSASLFAKQVQRVGLRVQVAKQESSTFLSNKANAPLYTTFWGTNDSVVFLAGKLMISAAGTNETSWHDPEFDEAYRQAISTTDPDRHARMVREMQRIEHERSGYLLWGMADGVDIARDVVQGLPRLPGYGRYQLESAWLSA